MQYRFIGLVEGGGRGEGRGGSEGGGSIEGDVRGRMIQGDGGEGGG